MKPIFLHFFIGITFLFYLPMLLFFFRFILKVPINVFGAFPFLHEFCLIYSPLLILLFSLLTIIFGTKSEKKNWDCFYYCSACMVSHLSNIRIERFLNFTEWRFLPRRVNKYSKRTFIGDVSGKPSVLGCGIR